MSIPKDIEVELARAAEKERERQADLQRRREIRRAGAAAEKKRESAAEKEAIPDAQFIVQWATGPDANAIRTRLHGRGIDSVCLSGLVDASTATPQKEQHSGCLRVSLDLETPRLHVNHRTGPSWGISDFVPDAATLVRWTSPAVVHKVAAAIRSGTVWTAIKSDLRAHVHESVLDEFDWEDDDVP